MMDLYRRNDGAPEPLPAVAYTADGLSRTDLANQPESRKELGFTFFASYDPATQRVVKRGDGYVIEILPPDAPNVSANVVTMRQARLALQRAGKLDAADAEIAKLPGEAGAEARIEWEYAMTLRRDHRLVAALGQILSLDQAAIDALFTEAAQIL